jgi:hypothetical protein
MPRAETWREIVVSDWPSRPVLRVRLVNRDPDETLANCGFEIRDRDNYERAVRIGAERGKKVGIETNLVCDSFARDVEAGAPGEYAIPYLPGGVGAFAIRVVIPGRAPIQSDWLWASGEDLGPIEIAIPKNGQIRGRVVDAETGKWLESVDIQVFADGADAAGGRGALASIRTDGRGAFAIRGLEKGNYVVRASGASARTDVKCAVAGPGQPATEIEIKAEARPRHRKEEK